MGLPRVRFTVRHQMLVVAAIAVSLAFVEEFSEGLPPRYVVRGIPARIARLRPGMTWEQTREILGLEQTWLTGGTGARPAEFEGNGHYMYEVYYVRPPRVVARMARVGGGNALPVKVSRSTAMVQLWFSTNIRAGVRDWQQDKSTRLVRAIFSNDFTTIAEMPGSQ